MKIGKKIQLTVTPLTFTYNIEDNDLNAPISLPDYFDNNFQWILPKEIGEQLKEYMGNGRRMVYTSKRMCQQGICIHTFYIVED